jgi:hypothetical protein
MVPEAVQVRVKQIVVSWLAMGAILGCSPSPDYSLDAARSHAGFVMEYEVPWPRKLKEYTVEGVWIEENIENRKLYLCITLRGRHADSEPRIRVKGYDEFSYAGTGSDSTGLVQTAYRIKKVEDSFELSRGDEQIIVKAFK